MSDGMARSRGGTKLRNYIQRIACGDRPHGQIPVDGKTGLPSAGAVTPQTVFKLIDGGTYHGDAVGGTNSDHAVLRHANRRWNGEVRHLVGRVSVVAVHTRRMPILIQQRGFGGVMRAIARAEWMPRLPYVLRKDVGGSRR